jgi:hypothetical protein
MDISERQGPCFWSSPYNEGDLPKYIFKYIPEYVKGLMESNKAHTTKKLS